MKRLYCENCIEKKYDKEVLKSSIDYALEHDYEWKDRKIYVGFKSENEKTLFMNGILKGYRDALFWVSEYFGLVPEFEDKFDKMSKDHIPYEN